MSMVGGRWPQVWNFRGDTWLRGGMGCWRRRSGEERLGGEEDGWDEAGEGEDVDVGVK